MKDRYWKLNKLEQDTDHKRDSGNLCKSPAGDRPRLLTPSCDLPVHGCTRNESCGAIDFLWSISSITKLWVMYQRVLRSIWIYDSEPLAVKHFAFVHSTVNNEHLTIQIPLLGCLVSSNARYL